MAAATKIQWADHTFNPWIGCSKVSEGCKHCYAAALANARPAFVLGPGVPRTKDGKKLPIWGDEAPRRMTGAAYWRQPAKWNRGAQAAGERRRVFCASLADFFEDKPGLDEIRTLVYEQILATPWLDWLLLTKRPENMERMLPWGPCGIGPTPWRNVWIGFTGENQARFDERWALIREIPAAVIFASIEPQLGPVVLPPDFLARGQGAWCITGGESGPHARSYCLTWPRRLIAQCEAARVPAFFKQAGARPYERKNEGWIGNEGDGDWDYDWLKLRDKKGGDLDELPADLRVREVPAP